MNLKEGFIICDSQMKKEIILNNREFKNYIFYTINELESKLLGNCENNAIFEIMNKYCLSYELALEYLKYIPYVDSNIEYNNIKLDSLATIKRYLMNNNLYSIDKFFLLRLSQYPITFIDCINNKKTNTLINLLAKYTSVYIENTKTINYNPRVYEFNNIYDEAIFIFNNIMNLVKNNISLNKISIINIDDSYKFIFKRLSRHYNIPIYFSNDKNISYLDISKEFIRLCDELDSFSLILERLDKKSEYFNEIFNLIITYSLEDKSPKEYKGFLENKLKSISFKQIKYQQMVSTKYKNKYSDDEYVFYCGLNLGASPKVYKDDQYLNDEELNKLGMLTSIEKNKEAKDNLISLLLNTKNITISYKRMNKSIECFPSNIIKELNLEVIKDTKIEFGYSKKEDNLRLGIDYNRYLKYKTVSQSLKKYDISILKYQSYDNKYKGINKELIDERFKNNKLKLSYSSIKTFYQCPFQYYVDRILYLNEFKPNLAARLGSFSHKVLEESYNPDFNFCESVFNNTIEYAVDSKDRFYFKQMENVLRSLITYNLEYESFSKLDCKELEPHISYEFDNCIFEGFVDKLLYTEINNEIYAAIIDYKTGKDVISLSNVEDGFHLQLPSYIYLLSKYEKFKDKKINIIGIYLQKVNIIALNNTIDIVAQREASFKLQGFTISDHSLIPLLDPNYNSSKYIQSLSTVKSGEFAKFAKIVKKEEIEELKDIVEELIINAGDDILNARFDISPKMISGKNESCTFCKYKDICYMTYNDLVELELKPYPKRDGE